LSRPTIGITSYWAPVTLGSWRAGATVTFQGYIEGTRLAGGRPIVIPADPHLIDHPEDMVEMLDGIVFVGGDDIAPEEYGAQRHAMSAATRSNWRWRAARSSATFRCWRSAADFSC
jgi:putative glutamine amidotransferase